MFCKNCGKQIDDDSAVCTYCGQNVGNSGASQPQPTAADSTAQQVSQGYNVSQPQQSNQQYSMLQNGQPGYQSYPAPPVKVKKKGKGKFIVLGVLAVIFVIIIAAAMGGDESVPAGNDNTQIEGDGTSADDGSITPSEWLNIFDDDPIDFNLSMQSQIFLDTHPNYFPCKDADFNALYDASEYVSYEDLTKNVSEFAEQFIYLSYVTVNDIQEIAFDTELSEYVTYIHVYDEFGNDYVGWYPGKMPEVYENSLVTLYALPIDMVYFDNIGGATTRAIMLAVCDFEVESIY